MKSSTGNICPKCGEFSFNAERNKYWAEKAERIERDRAFKQIDAVFDNNPTIEDLLALQDQIVELDIVLSLKDARAVTDRIFNRIGEMI
jgi:hypothetical protein